MNRRWWALAALVLSVLVIGLDSTVLNVALPTLAGALRADTGDLQWIVDGYLVVFAVLLLPAGLLGDRYGRKKLLITGLVLFGAASLAASYTTGVPGLVAARAAMGFGAALIIPLSMAVIPSVFPPAERTKAIAIWSAGVALGLPLGPVLGGWLLDHYWWGSIFLINVPVVLLAVLVTALMVPESRNPGTEPVDLAGVALSVAGLGALVYGAIERSPGWTVAGVAGLAGFLLWQRRARHPMLDLRLYADRNFLWGSVVATLATFGLMGVLFVLPLYLHQVLGYDALGVGLRLIPLMAGLLVAGLASSRILPRVGPRLAVGGGLVVLAVGLALGATTDAADGYGWTALWLSVLGVGTGASLVPAMDTVLATLPAERTGIGSAAVQAMRQVGGALGVAVLGSLLSGRLPDLVGGMRLVLATCVVCVAFGAALAGFGLSGRMRA